MFATMQRWTVQNYSLMEAASVSGRKNFVVADRNGNTIVTLYPLDIYLHEGVGCGERWGGEGYDSTD